MMHKQVKVIAMALVMTLCIGCAGLMPQTDNNAERLAVAKLSFATVENTASDMRVAGVLSDTRTFKVDKYFMRVRALFVRADSMVNKEISISVLLVEINGLILDIQGELGK